MVKTSNTNSQIPLILGHPVPCIYFQLSSEPKIKYPRTRTQIPTLLKTKAITVLKTSLNLRQRVLPGWTVWPDLGLLLLLSDLMETTSWSSSSLRSADLRTDGYSSQHCGVVMDCVRG